MARRQVQIAKRHPNHEAFLTHLAVQEQVAASTQNQALKGQLIGNAPAAWRLLKALLFLYREVLNILLLDTPLPVPKVVEDVSDVTNCYICYTLTYMIALY